MTRIRAARDDELELLVEIEREARRAFYEIGMPEIAEDDPGTAEALAGAWVAVDDDDRPVAYLISGVVDGCAHVDQVSVAPSHAHRRLGAALIDHLAAVAGTPLTLTTFERNKTRERSSERGTKAAASRQGNEARAGTQQAKQSANGAVGGLKSAVRSLGDAAVSAGKSVATRSKAGKK